MSNEWEPVPRLLPPSPTNSEVPRTGSPSKIAAGTPENISLTGPEYRAMQLLPSPSAHEPVPTSTGYGVATPQTKSHIVRNVILIVVPAFVLVVGAFVYLVMAWMGNSEPAKFAIQTAENNSIVQQRIGAPLHHSFLVSGQINMSGKNDGFADLTIPVTGPHGKGELFAREMLSDAGWKIVFLSYSDQSGSKVLIQSRASSD